MKAKRSIFSKTTLKRLAKSQTTRNIGLSFAIKLLGTAAGFLTSIILARKAGASIVGTYSLASSIITLALVFAKFGLDTTLIKYISISFHGKKGGDIKKTMWYSSILTLITSSIASAIIVALLSWLSNDIFHNENLTAMLFPMIFSVFPLAIVQIFVGAFKGINLTKTGLFFESTSLPLCFSTILTVIFFLFKKEVGFEELGIFYLFASLISFVLSAIILLFKISRYNDSSSSDYSFKPVINTAKPLLLVNSTNYLLSCADTIMLGIWCSSDSIGVYSVATKITTLFSMIMSIINAMLGPKFAIMYHDGKIDELKAELKKTSRIMRTLSLLLIIGLALMSYPILSIWGKDFAAAWPIFVISSVGQFFVLAKGPIAVLLMMCGYEKVHRNNTLICAILNVILNARLIPPFGIYGAVIATATSLAAKNILTMIAGNKIFKNK
jgi:O-antigen/teichoic acid export membrane protein